MHALGSTFEAFAVCIGYAYARGVDRLGEKLVLSGEKNKVFKNTVVPKRDFSLVLAALLMFAVVSGHAAYLVGLVVAPDLGSLFMVSGDENENEHTRSYTLDHWIKLWPTNCATY